MVRARAAVVRSLREEFHQRDFLEIETPMLQTQHGGAAARPFRTHMNAFDIDLYLRIAPELFLKRAVVGGIEKVFEINRNFRNEGSDSTHSPEFTMLEVYEAYGDYNTMATLATELILRATKDVFGTTLVTLADGSEYELGGEWESIELYPSLSQAAGVEITPETTLPDLLAVADSAGVEVDRAHATPGKVTEELWEPFVAGDLYRPA